MGSRVARGRALMRAAALLLALLAAGPALAECREDLARLKFPTGEARFSVEIADDEAERAQGLMGRKDLSGGAGMLFIYDSARPVSFWMRNTPLPLDMIFIDETGTVVRVHENAVPFDETPIPSGQPVLMVLEIRGGLARRIGISEGAQLIHPRLDPALAALACE